MPTGRRDTEEAGRFSARSSRRELFNHFRYSRARRAHVEAVDVSRLMIPPLGKTPLTRCPAPLPGRADPHTLEAGGEK
jgi:hypothetical protein